MCAESVHVVIQNNLEILKAIFHQTHIIQYNFGIKKIEASILVAIGCNNTQKYQQP